MARAHTWAIAAVAALTSIGFASRAHGADAALERIAAGLRANELKSVRYSGDGVGWTFGQAYKPGQAWPKIRLNSWTRTVNYETGAARDEIVLTRAEALGGGGYPHTGMQRNDQYVYGDFAWNQTAAGPAPGPRFVAERLHALWITPYGVVKAALRNNAKVGTGKVGSASMTTLTFTEPKRFRAVAYVDGGRVVRVESRIPDAVLGETDVVTTYGGYADFGGFAFPTRITQTQGGHPTLELAVREVIPNAPADIALPDAVRTATERVTVDKVADGVWFIAGGSHNSVAIEMKDYMILIETPLNDGRSMPVIEQVKKLVPGKPIRYVVNSHGHFDHSGGLRAAVGEGATIVTQAQNKAYFERAFATPNTIAPDHLAKSGKKGADHDGRREDGPPRRRANRRASPRGRQQSQRRVPGRLPAEGEALDRGGLVHAGPSEYAATGAAQSEQHEPRRQSRAPEAFGGQDTAAARARRAFVGALRGGRRKAAQLSLGTACTRA